MRDFCHTEKINASPFLGTACKRCASDNLYVKQQSVHLGLFCRECGLWQKWLSRRSAHRYHQGATRPANFAAPTYKPVPEQIRANFDSSRDDFHKSCAQRFEKIERELMILTRAILSAGWLKGRGGPLALDVHDDDIAELAAELAEGEAER
jgi:hypothetical protein